MAADIANKWTPQMFSAPALSFSAITPSNTVDDPNGPFKAIYVGDISGGATITVVGLDNVAVAFAGVVAGSILPLVGRRVNSTGTAAASLVALR